MRRGFRGRGRGGYNRSDYSDRTLDRAESDMSIGEGVQFQIEGFTSLANVDSLIQFIQNKAPQNVTITDANLSSDGRTVTAFAANKSQAAAIQTLSGIRYIREKLFIKVLEGKSAPFIDLRSVLPTLYDPNHRYLNLERFNDQYNLYQRHSIIKLLETIHELFPELVSLNLSNNGLQSMKNYTSLKDACPNLRNLSLESNSLATYNDLSGIENLELKELILIGNPLHKTDPSKKAIYVNEIVKRFSKLETLDRENLQLVKFDIPDVTVPENVLKPFIKPGFSDSQGTLEFASKFIATFFGLYDQNRVALTEMYDPSATFTVSVSSIEDEILSKLSALKRKGKENYVTGIEGLDSSVTKFPFGHYHYPSRYSSSNDKNCYSAYLAIDHNLKKISQVKNLVFSQQSIINSISGLPKTKHIESSFIVDCWQQATQPPTLLIFLNGEFYERNISLI